MICVKECLSHHELMQPSVLKSGKKPVFHGSSPLFKLQYTEAVSVSVMKQKLPYSWKFYLGLTQKYALLILRKNANSIFQSTRDNGGE